MGVDLGSFTKFELTSRIKNIELSEDTRNGATMGGHSDNVGQERHQTRSGRELNAVHKTNNLHYRSGRDHKLNKGKNDQFYSFDT